MAEAMPEQDATDFSQTRQIAQGVKPANHARSSVARGEQCQDCTCQAELTGVGRRRGHSPCTAEESPTLRRLYPPLTKACSPIRERCKRALWTIAPSLMMLSLIIECSTTVWGAMETYGPTTDRRI